MRSKYNNLFRRLFGILVLICIVFFVYHSSIKFLRAQPSFQLNKKALINGLERPYTAPAIDGIANWINSSPLRIDELKGKVILIDFWTYSCINCIRTIPHLNNWYNKYHDQGLVIIGIHSPEFEFEQELKNVKAAVNKYGIQYPVALDNQFTTWKNYQNEYWPTEYLINKEGEVVYQHYGEGEYDVTENNIRYLLGLNAVKNDAVINENDFATQTPEIYLGYLRSANFAEPDTITKDQIATYHYPATLPKNEWALEGQWLINKEKIIAGNAGASLKLNFHAGKVYAVMGITKKPVKIVVKSMKQTQEIIVKSHQLYTLLELNNNTDGTLEIIVKDPGLEIYTFTFGS